MSETAPEPVEVEPDLPVEGDAYVDPDMEAAMEGETVEFVVEGRDPDEIMAEFMAQWRLDHPEPAPVEADETVESEQPEADPEE